MTENTAEVVEGRKDRKQAQGHEFALQTLAETRYHAKQYLELLNATNHIARNSIFLPEDYNPKEHPHARANAAILAYRDELSKDRYLKNADAFDFHQEPYTSVEVPTDLTKGEAISVTVTDPQNEVNPAQADLDTTEIPVSLKNADWWSMRFITIQKNIDSPYYSRESESEQRKVVLPPRALRATFHRVDDLAAEMGVLLQIQKSNPHNTT